MELNTILQGDCLQVLKTLPSESVDCVVTDPPYELGFMGKSWDNTGIANNVDMWKECLRVLKPGGHLLSFGGTRTYHRMASAIEDAGFEIRDMIEWVYGSGFPKSLNIGKAVDKLAERGENHKIMDFVIEAAEKQGKTKSDLSKLFLSKNGKPTGWLWNKASHNQTLTDEQFSVLKDYLNLPFESLYEMEKKVIGRGKAGLTKGTIANFAGETEFDIAALVTEEAKKWEGWGTALKPSHEPICMARKPLAEKTVAENCLKWGTGGINIDESRVGYEKDDLKERIKRSGVNCLNKEYDSADGKEFSLGKATVVEPSPLGRFPANLIHDNSEEVRECFPETKSGGTPKIRSNKFNAVPYNMGGGQTDENIFGNSGNASRFFRAIPNDVVDYNDFLIYNRSILTNIKQLCGQHLTKKKTDIILGGVIQEAERFIQDAELLIFGNSEMEKFLTDTASTIKTLIAQMTELKTLNVLPNWPIMKFTEDYEKTIKLLKELNTEDVKNAESINHLIAFKREMLELIRDIARNVVIENYENGKLQTENESMLMPENTNENIKKNIGERKNFKSIIYQAKASKSERGEQNNHPTVKPIALMEYLINMVTREGQTVLDPFAGSGTTLIASKKLGRKYIGIELEPEYVKIAEARLISIKERLL